MKLLVCGGRDFADAERVDRILKMVHAKRPITILIEGGAAGADRLSRYWAERNGISIKTYEADWKTHGKGAGPIRNQLMIDDAKPDGVLAFPGGRGTSDMIKRARAAGLKVMLIFP